MARTMSRDPFGRTTTTREKIRNPAAGEQCWTCGCGPREGVTLYRYRVESDGGSTFYGPGVGGRIKSGDNERRWTFCSAQCARG